MCILPQERLLARFKMYTKHLSNPELDKELFVLKIIIRKSVPVTESENVHFALEATFVPFQIFTFYTHLIQN